MMMKYSRLPRSSATAAAAPAMFVAAPAPAQQKQTGRWWVLLLVLVVAVGAWLLVAHFLSFFPFASSSSTSTPSGGGNHLGQTAGVSPQTIIDVIVVQGQSNAQGRGQYLSTSSDSYSGSNLYQFVIGDQFSCDSAYQVTECPGAAALNGTIQPLTSEPLIDAWPSTGSYSTQIGFVLAYLKSHIAEYPTHNVIVVQSAVGGTAFSTSDWVAPTGQLWLRSAKAANAVMAMYPGANLAAFLWCHGEADIGEMTVVSYQNALTTLINSNRAHFTGANTTTPFTILGLNPFYMETIGIQAQMITMALRNAAFLLPAATFTFAPGSGADSSYSDSASTYGIVNMNAAAQRINGPALFAAQTSTAPLPTSIYWTGSSPNAINSYQDSHGIIWTSSAVGAILFPSGFTSCLYENSVTTQATANTADSTLYKQGFTSPNAFSLNFALAPGNYSVTLLLAEYAQDCTSSGCRVFSVSINGQPCMSSIDVFALAGGANIAYNLLCSSPVAVTASAPTVSVLATPITSNPRINSVQILPVGTQSHLAPASYVAAGQASTFAYPSLGAGAFVYHPALNGTLQPWDFFTSSPTAGIASGSSAYSPTTPTAPPGGSGQYAFVQASQDVTATISTLVTGWSSGKHLSFSYAQRGSDATHSLQVQVVWDSTQVVWSSANPIPASASAGWVAVTGVALPTPASQYPQLQFVVNPGVQADESFLLAAVLVG